MQVIKTDIPDVKVIEPKVFGDERGFFLETFRTDWFKKECADVDFVQDNHSLSRDVGVLRGLHYQAPPKAQDKLVRVLKGKIYDVAVDIRKDSPTFGQWVGAEISAENWTQIFVPKGFAHGFVTLEPNTEVAYKVSDLYAPDLEDAVIWNDPDLNIDWPIDPEIVQLSAKDKVAKTWAEMKDDFPF